MSHVLPIEFNGSGEKFLERLRALPELLRHVTGEMTRLRLGAAWKNTRKVQVFESPAQGRVPYEYDRGSDSVRLYPMLFGRRPDADLYGAFGLRHWYRNLDQPQQVQWVRSLVYPNMDVIDKFKELLGYGTDYQAILASFSDPDHRLIVIHLINALLKNHTPAHQAKLLDLDHYAPVSDFLSGNKPYSLKDVLKSIRPAHEDRHSYAAAFAEYCVNRGKFLGSGPAAARIYRSLFSAVTF